MAFRYVVKKRMVGIGTKTEKYVAASYSVANIDFDRLCDQVTSQGMVPRGIVKAVLDGMIAHSAPMPASVQPYGWETSEASDRD